MTANSRTGLSNDDGYTHIVCDIRHYIGARGTRPHARCGAWLADTSGWAPPTCPGCAAIQCGMDAR
jgi:hypothetical protein